MDTSILEIDEEVGSGKKGILARIAPIVIILFMFIVMFVTVFIMAKNSTELKNTIEDLKIENHKLQELLDRERKIDVTYVGNKLESISELAVAKMTYNGIIHFEEGKIPLITKKEFYMAYRVSLKVGFDLSKAEVDVTEDAVTVNLPEAEIYEPNVDEKSFQYFDVSFGLFNPEKMTDLSEAITEAKEDVLAQPETQELKTTAKEHVKLLIRGLLENEIGDRTLTINFGNT